MAKVYLRNKQTNAASGSAAANGRSKPELNKQLVALAAGVQALLQKQLMPGHWGRAGSRKLSKL